MTTPRAVGSLAVFLWVIALGVLRGHAAGAAEVWLEVPGVDGDSAPGMPPGWIRALSAGMRVQRTNSHFTMRPLTVEKPLDRTSPLLARHCAAATEFPLVTLRYHFSESTNHFAVELELIDAVFTSVAVQSKGGALVETVETSFKQLNWSYFEDAGAQTAIYSAALATRTVPAGFSGISFGGARVKLNWQAEKGRSYSILASEDLTGPFFEVQVVHATEDGPMGLELPIGPGRQFFLVQRYE